jgi:aminopeptidase N
MVRVPRFVAGLVAVAVVAAGCSRPTTTIEPVPTTTPPAVSGDFAPGGNGLGDRYFPMYGNGGYDVLNYDLDVTYDPATDVLDGVATITANATSNLSAFNLDFTGLTTKSVKVDGADAKADQQDAELVVTPPKGIPSGAKFTTTIAYGGVPKGYSAPQLGDVGFLSTDDGAIAIGEPEVAASWYPVNDHPRDKATYTIKITAPDALAALSNGVLQEKKAAAKAGFTTWTWSESVPMASYLATVIIGSYRVQEGTHDGKPVVTAVQTSLPTTIDTTMARTPEIIDYLSSVFGPYPFEAMGGIVIADQRIRFALENQSRPVYSRFFFGRGNDDSGVLAHELTHQWFGDSVSVNEWVEIWLNEGFATYGQWLWTASQGGPSLQQMFDQNYGAPASSWSIPTGAPGGPEKLFDNFAVYTRGAMTLHALRVTVGDGAFFKILKAWPEEKKNGNAVTTEFIALAERISGQQLDQLFNDWLYGTVRPPRPTAR